MNREIKAVKFRKDGFYSQALAFGGEEGPDEPGTYGAFKDLDCVRLVVTYSF